MAERLHPGVFIEERSRGVAPITGVSTSTYGTVGFTLRGPTDEATLVSSFEQFQRIFGGFTDQSGVPLHLFAFFANGGRRAYVVRVVASDALASDGFVTSDAAEEAIETSDGASKVVGPDAVGVGFALSTITERATRNDGGNWYADGYRIGDYVTIANAEDVANNGTWGPLTAVQNIADGYIEFDGANSFPTTNADDTLITFVNLKAFGGTLAHLPVKASSVSITWRGVGTPVVAAASNNSPATDAIALDFAGRVVVATDMEIIPGTVTLTTTVAALPYLYTDSAADGTLKDVGGDVRGYINYKTGHWALSAEIVAGLPDAVSAITIGYTPQGTLYTVIDDGAGALTGTALLAPGTIDYTTGVYAFTVKASAPAATPANAAILSAAYTQNLIDIDPISKGAWGNGLTVQVRGNVDSFTRLTAAYSRYDLQVLLDGVVQETFLDLSFTDATDADYVLTAVNDPTQGSDLITLVDPANEAVAPATLNGLSRTRGAGSGNAANQNYGSTAAADTDGYPSVPVGFRSIALETPVQPGSVVITYTDNAGVARTITDNGSGALIGHVDPAPPTGYNRINYTNGKFAFRTVAPVSEAETSNLAVPTGPQTGSIISITYRKTPSETATSDGMTTGTDGVAGITNAQLTSPTLKTARQGMYALLTPDELLNVGIPDAAGDVTMIGDQITEAESNQKWFIVVAPPPGMTPQEVRDWRRFTLGISSSYGALYYPYIKVTDPFTNRGSNIPPIGHIAGVYARTDTNKNVSKAPAGTDDGKLLFTNGLERKLEFGEIDTFFASQVNALVDTPQTGRAVWGARTLENPPDDFRYVQVRRLFNFLKTSVFNSTHGFVFENVGQSLRQRIQISVESFLRNLFNQGYFSGASFTDAVVVVCDESNNTPDNEEAGEVICDIYIAPSRPGEFILFRLQQRFSSAA